ncbi:MAG TPA: MobF family relaxase, partial [Opitutaceae bacterium]|nr:MobF family relaxase [Opitutaceae bacterium]
MFTAKPQKNRNAATTYFDEHLSHNDYYTQKEALAGYWVGHGVELLGLKRGESVTRDAFLKLCDNQHPGTGEKLTQINLSGRRIFFDFTCSAPKSVSILAVTMDDKRIVEAHREAAAIAIKELEAFAATRVRKRGAMEDRTTGNLVGAAFLHTSSRALDPQLHTHFTLFNATFDGTEKRWKALQTSGMFAAIHYGTAVYRNELAKRLHGLGYDTRATAHGFEVAGVAPELIERFSKRSKQRNAAVAREEKRLGRKLSNNEVSHVVHQSRPKKLKNASERDVQAAQLSEIGFFEKRALRAVVAQAKGQRVEPAERVTQGEAVRHSLDHVFARQSVAPEHELLEAALVKGYGQLGLKELKHAFGSDESLVKVGQEFSTKEILRAELGLIRSVNNGLGVASPIAKQFKASASLGPDQRAALVLVLSSSDRITGFRGLAGTGKTTTLQELRRAVESAGLAPVFCAPTAAATEVLRKDGFKEASTLAKLLQSEELPRASVVVLDEAGFVGTSDMAKLFDLARRMDSRVVLVGDTGQHAAVARGDALRVIEEHSGYRFGTLTQIRRQRNEDFRATVSLAAEHKTKEAFQKLQRAGEVIEHEETATLYQKAAAAYLSATEHGKEALLVSPTWAEIEAVTDEVRSQLRERGTLAAKEETVRVFDPLGWTDAQKQLTDHYEPGQRLRFVKATKYFEAGEMAEVIGHKGQQLLVRHVVGDKLEAGTTSFSPSRSPSSFEVGEAREINVAAGDVLLLRANAQNFTNGERVQVKSVHRQAITLEDGRTLPEDYRTFTHGYAVTSHAAQGKTVDEVMVVASSRSFAAVSQESFYVGISRARERARIYTDDADLLGYRVQDAHTRKAAVELEGLREALHKAGFTRRQEVTPQIAVEEKQSRGERIGRTLRVGRTETVRLVQQWAQDFRQWIG